MTTCVVVKKDGEVAIAADALVTFGDTRLSRAYERNQKVFPVGESFIALAGTTAHFPVMRSLLSGLGEECRLGCATTCSGPSSRCMRGSRPSTSSTPRRTRTILTSRRRSSA